MSGEDTKFTVNEQFDWIESKDREDERKIESVDEDEDEQQIRVPLKFLLFIFDCLCKLKCFVDLQMTLFFHLVQIHR